MITLYTAAQIEAQRKLGGLKGYMMVMESPVREINGKRVAGGDWLEKPADKHMYWRAKGYREAIEISDLPRDLQESAQMASRPLTALACKQHDVAGEVCTSIFNRPEDLEDHIEMRHPGKAGDEDTGDVDPPPAS